jgi:hypothetical protein
MEREGHSEVKRVKENVIITNKFALSTRDPGFSRVHGEC